MANFNIDPSPGMEHLVRIYSNNKSDNISVELIIRVVTNFVFMYSLPNSPQFFITHTLHQIRGDGVGAFLSAIQADVDASAAPAPAAPSSTNGNTVEEKENDGSSDTKMDEA